MQKVKQVLTFIGWTIFAFLVLAVLSFEIWQGRDWIARNATSLEAVAACLTGLALFVFAWLTYRLSRKMVELQYAPWLQIYCEGAPEAGEFHVEGQTYAGLKWQFFLLNSGQAPAWVDRIKIEVSPDQRWKKWYGIDTWCYLINDSDTKLVNKSAIVDGQSHYGIAVLLYHDQTATTLRDQYPRKPRFTMKVELFQHRQVGGKVKSGWLKVLSDSFELPSKFGKLN